MDWHITLTLGLMLAAALLGGLAAEWLRLPKVTAYLFTGIALGPLSEKMGYEVVPHEHIYRLEPITALAMALVLFNLGSRFSLPELRRLFRRVWPISLGELTLTFTLVTGGLIAIGTDWRLAVLLGALAMEAAPATTILVLNETQSEGPITRLTGMMVAVSNLVVILTFELLFLLVSQRGGVDSTSVMPQVQSFLIDVFGSVVLGIAAGLVVSYSTSLLAGGRWLIFLVGAILIVLGICETVHMPYMLTFLAMGMAVANSSEHTRELQTELDRLTMFLAVLFFVIHGAELQLEKFIEAGMVGAVYIVMRTTGKYVGVRVMATLRGEEPVICQWLGATLLAQAGSALALSAIAVHRNPELGRELQAIILGTVVFFEIIGPILIKQSVVRAGEVPLVQVLHHTSTGVMDELRKLVNLVLGALGYDPLSRRPASDLTVSDLVRRNVKGLPQSATFNEIASFIEHSHDETFPVVGDKNQLVGIIRYRDLSSALFDPKLGSLVLAADLATAPEQFLYPDDAVSRAWEMFRTSRDDCLPVVSREHAQRLVGTVRRQDILRLFIRGGKSGGGGGH